MLDRYLHVDGGEYVIVDDQNVSMKMDDGRWERAVLYRRVIPSPTPGQYMYEGKNHFVTTQTRWDERFTKVGTTHDA